MKNKLAFKIAKLKGLYKLWDSIYWKIQIKARRTNDAYGKNLCYKIQKIPKEVKLEVLTKFVEACYRLHNIAFFQWKSIFVSEISFALESILVAQITKLNNELESVEKVSKKGLQQS